MKSLIGVLLFCVGLWAQAPAVVIRGARVVDGTGEPARMLTVVIRGTKIVAVAPDAPVPDGARVIDGAGQTLMPGLFDLHTHLSASAVTGLAGDWGKSLKAYLACGITTVNDYATNGEMFAPLRQLEKAIQSKEMTPLPVQRAGPAIDDMEHARTQLDTLRVNGTDAGVDHSAMLMLPVLRRNGNHALLVAGQLAKKERPFVRVEFPLTAGAIAPADLSGYTGVSFDVRGEAMGRLLVQAYHVRSTDAYAAPFTPSGTWKRVKIPFASLRRRGDDAGTWDAKDARALLFELGGTAGSSVWMELDDLRFY